MASDFWRTKHFARNDGLWDNLLVDHVPTGGAGMLEYSPAGNQLTQTDPVKGDV